MDKEDMNQEKDVEVIEFNLNDNKIDELVSKLQSIKDTERHLHMDIDDENHLLIHHESDNLK